MRYHFVILAALAVSGCMMSAGYDGESVDLPLLSDLDLAAAPESAGLATGENEPSLGSLFRAVIGGRADQAEDGMELVCNAPRSQYGTEVDKMPEYGRGFTLYDSAPGNTRQRDFYLTGFDDGCARKFTAALALLGAPRMHELVRYDPMRAGVPYSSVDTAYERVKRQVCGAAIGQPCGERRLSALERSTAFLTIYETFGSSGNRVELLLHRGDVIAREYAAN